MYNGHGGDIYSYGDITDFSANINPLEMPTEIADAVLSGVQSLGSYPDWSCRELRGKIAQKLGCAAEDVICGNGAADLIFSIAYAYRPKKALLVSPCFAEYEAALRAIDAEIVYHELSADNDFALTDAFEKQLTADLDITFLCVPNNPTGAVIDKERLTKIADICAENHILFVLDECFNEFLEMPEKYSMLDNISGREQLVILKSFTKMFALAGMRLGYAVSCNYALFEKIYSVRQPWTVSTLAQRAGLAALEQTAFVTAARKYLQEERKYLAEELEALGCRVFEGYANFIFFYAAEDLKERLLQKGFLIRDCGNYRGLTRGYYRIAVKLHEDNVRLIEAVKEIFN